MGEGKETKNKDERKKRSVRRGEKRKEEKSKREMKNGVRRVLDWLL